jgi:hypothetical protein
MAVQRDGQRQCLDREGGCDAFGLQGGADGLGDTEVTKGFGAAIQVSGRRLGGRALVSCVRTQGSRLQ